MNVVSREIGVALDKAIEEFTLEGVLDVSKHFDKWVNECKPLNKISTYQLAKYIIEGYEYPKKSEKKSIQKYAEEIEVILKKECESDQARLTYREFHSLNILLLELQAEGLYKSKIDAIN